MPDWTHAWGEFLDDSWQRNVAGRMARNVSKYHGIRVMAHADYQDALVTKKAHGKDMTTAQAHCLEVELVWLANIVAALENKGQALPAFSSTQMEAADRDVEPARQVKVESWPRREGVTMAERRGK